MRGRREKSPVSSVNLLVVPLQHANAVAYGILPYMHQW